MAIFNFTDLITPVTRAEAQASLYEVYGILGLKTSSWKSGAVVRTMAVAQSVIISALSQLQAKIARLGFLELSEGVWLDAVAHFVYGIDRIPATFATGVLTLVNGGGGEYEVDPDDLIFTNPATKFTYRNTEHILLGPGVTLTNVAIRASVAGSGSTSEAGAITELTTTLLNVTCTNPADVIGRDEETDPQLRTRCAESLGALSPFGPWDAYSSAVRNAKRPDSSSLGIVRIRPVKDGYGNVTVYVATATGEVLGDVDDPASDLGIASDAVARWAEPLAVNASVVSADPVVIAVTYEAWMYNTSGRSNTQVADEIQSRLSAFMAAQPIGGNKIDTNPGRVYHDAIRSAIAAAFPGFIFHVVVTTPAADVELDANEVAVSGVPTVTAIHQIAPGDGISV
jgi:phage-related baseplate assembly protein